MHATSISNEPSIDPRAEIAKADVDVGLLQEELKHDLLHLGLFLLWGARKVMFGDGKDYIEPVARQLGLRDLVSKLLVLHLALIALSVVLLSSY